MSKSKNFVEIFCTNDQAIMPHEAGKVLAKHGDLVEVEVRCRKCGNKVQYSTDKLPEGFRIFQIRVAGKDNPSLPAELRPKPLSRLEEDFAVIATSAQQAHEVAERVTSLLFKGHIVHWYVDGELHADERF